MQKAKFILTSLLLLLFCQIGTPTWAQLGFSFDIKKPTQYDDRQLESEKSDSKKFTLPRRLAQNSFTHYNYFFNAQNKLNDVIEDAKKMHREDYTTLLPFYNYSLDVTAQNKTQLDSIIYKTTTGIVLHDLRSDWVDNMYLLMGAAYYLRKQFDSASLTFQFINFAFADKEKDGYYKTIGSNLDGNNAFSIVSKEKKGLPQKIFNKPPSRNDAFLWLIRTNIAEENYAEAASLIAALKNDIQFPKRLLIELEEVQALWFYKNNMYDSAAFHLSKALSITPTKREKARWEFLTAQLYQKSGDFKNASKFYNQAIKNTTDPVMEIYAHLNSIQTNKDESGNQIENSIAALMKMATRNKYSNFQDVIYYTAAQMEIERKQLLAAQTHLKKCITVVSDNVSLKNSAWYQLAELALLEKNYKQAFNCYDSINTNIPDFKNTTQINSQKKMLQIIAQQIDIIERQDSLLRIALLSEFELQELVKTLVKQIRKAQGLNEEIPTLTPIGATTVQPDLFATSSAKAEWYFYNTPLRSKGLAEFKSKWGNRSNADNWRRLGNINISQANRKSSEAPNSKTILNNPQTEISFEALYENIPLTEEKIKISHDSISQALFILGKSLTEEVEDFQSAILVLERLSNQFPSYLKNDEALFMLYYCYTKLGDSEIANSIKKNLETNFPNSNYTLIVTTGKNLQDKSISKEASRLYQNIYELFIEGNFHQANKEKMIADSLYGTHYWTPQLLYIEAVYFVKQKEEGRAFQNLSTITALFPGTPMAEKAANLVSILGRRAEIENEITQLQIASPIIEETKKIDTISNSNIVKKEVNKQVPEKIIKAKIITPFVFDATEKHSVIILLNNVDPVWVNETKNAFFLYNRSKYYNKLFDLSIIEISKEYKLLLISSFDNTQAAIDYINTAKPVTATQIIPWLKADKYSFSVITASNLEILKTQKDVLRYRKFMEEHFPGKF